MKKKLNYQLGYFVGEYIYANDLPTLNTDMLKSRRVINVSDEDFARHSEVCDKLHSTYKWNGGDGVDNGEFDVFKALNDELAVKYLPNELICHLPCILEVTNMKKFIKGIRDCLWDTDLCSYKLGKGDIIFRKGKYSSKIVLYLR